MTADNSTTMANNEDNLKPVRSKDEARERGRKGGIASGRSRRKHKELRELLIRELTKVGTNGMTKEEYLIAKALENHAKGKLSFKDLKDLQDLLGESALNVNVKSSTPLLIVSEETARKMKEDENNGGVR